MNHPPSTNLNHEQLEAEMADARRDTMVVALNRAELHAIICHLQFSATLSPPSQQARIAVVMDKLLAQVPFEGELRKLINLGWPFCHES